MTFEELIALGGAWAWANYSKDIIKSFAKSLASGAGEKAKEAALAGWERVEWATEAKKYGQAVQEMYGRVRVLGMSDPVPLEGIFTDVRILDRPSALRRLDIEKLRADPGTLDRLGRRIDGLKLVSDSKKRRLFILGKPGAGKTTFLKYVALQATKGTIDKVPIFVPLKAWADSHLELLPFVCKQFEICDFPDARPFVERILKRGDAIVLFDGLDEVNQEGQQRDKMIVALKDFSAQYSKAQCLITCRVAATEYEFEEFTYVELADFTDEQISTFAAKWFADEPAKLELFNREFSSPESKGLRELAKVPLLLSLLCLSFGETMSFPQRRVEIYEEALDALLKKWDASRSIKRDETYKGLSLGRKRQMLARIGAQTFQLNEYLLPQEQLARRITLYLRQLPGLPREQDVDGEAVLKAIEAQHGVLIERAHRIYSFSHLTLQEYFTAKYISEHAPIGVLREMLNPVYVANPRWREVVLLTASMLENADDFFMRFSGALKLIVQADPVFSRFMSEALKLTKPRRPEEQVHALRAYDKSVAAGVLYGCVTLQVYYSEEWRSHGGYPLVREHVERFLEQVHDAACAVLEVEFPVPDFEAHYEASKKAGWSAGAENEERCSPGFRRALPEDIRFDVKLAYLLMLSDKLTELAHRPPRDPHLMLQAIGGFISSVNSSVIANWDSGLNEDWHKFLDNFDPYFSVNAAEAVRELIRKHRPMGHEWRLTEEHGETLKRFFYGTLLFLESLQLAAVTDRASLVEGLAWRPPEATYR